jgi:hypothetical protein
MVSGTFFRQQLQEGYEVVFVVRLEHQFRKAAGMEPRDAIHRRIRRDPPADVLYTVAKRRKKLFPIHLFHADFPERLSSCLGSAAAQYVILPAPNRTTKSPGFAISATISGKSSGDGRKRASR